VTDPEGLSTVLLKLAEHASAIGALDTREDEHFRQVGARLSELGDHLASMTGTIDQTAELLQDLAGLEATVTELAERLKEQEEPEPKAYKPAPTAQWWLIIGDEREKELRRLRAWVTEVFIPGYGHLAAMLAPCWEEHELCLYLIDWLREYWNVLYLPKRRSKSLLAGQAEFATRLLPAAADQLARETTRCGHSRGVPNLEGLTRASRMPRPSPA
jgi:hypothetical protein